MSAKGEPVYIKELEWLARYYHQHGYKDQAREIIERIKVGSRQTSNVVNMFENDDEDCLA